MMRQWTAPRQKRSFLAPFVIGIAMWLGFPTGAGFQDMTSLVAGSEAATPRWSAVVEKSVAGAVQQADMPFANDDLPTGAISGAGVAVHGIGNVAFRTKNGVDSESPEVAHIKRTD